MAMTELVIQVEKPDGLELSLAALARGWADTRCGDLLTEMLRARFSDLFIWLVSGEFELRSSASLVEFVTPRGARDIRAHLMTMRPSQRYVDLALATAEIIKADVDYVDGWPVIACPAR